MLYTSACRGHQHALVRSRLSCPKRSNARCTANGWATTHFVGLANHGGLRRGGVGGACRGLFVHQGCKLRHALRVSTLHIPSQLHAMPETDTRPSKHRTRNLPNHKRAGVAARTSLALISGTIPPPATPWRESVARSAAVAWRAGAAGSRVSTIGNTPGATRGSENAPPTLSPGSAPATGTARRGRMSSCRTASQHLMRACTLGRHRLLGRRRESEASRGHISLSCPLTKNCQSLCSGHTQQSGRRGGTHSASACGSRRRLAQTHPSLAAAAAAAAATWIQRLAANREHPLVTATRTKVRASSI